MSAVASGRRYGSPRVFSRVLLFAALFAISVLLYGQGYFGTVSGEITDPTQAVVPGANVTLVDQQKGYQFTTTSDKSGRYVFTSIPPGVYSVSSEVAGFEKSVRTNITVNVSENATANLALKVATSRQSVDVQSQAQALATEDAVTGQVVNRRFINDLPLVDRYVLDFVTLGPGINNMSAWGIGRKLVDKAEKSIANEEVTTDPVRSRIAREAAHSFYLRLNFSRLKTSTVFTKSLTVS